MDVPAGRVTPVLAGIAIDVSGSMRSSIDNNASGDLSRLNSLRKIISDYADRQARRLAPTGTDRRTLLDVFVYAFGLSNLPIDACDLLSLSRVAGRAGHAHSIGHTTGVDARTRLIDIVTDAGRGGWRPWIEGRHNLTDAMAAQLLDNIQSFPAMVRHIADLLPPVSEQGASFVDDAGRMGPGMALTVNLILGTLGGGANGAVQSAREATSLREQRAEIEKAGRLVKVLATAPLAEAVHGDQELRSLVCVWFAGEVARELDRIGDTTRPLREAADLLWGQSSGVIGLEDFIYGNTPMVHALGLVKERFGRELPQYAGPVRPVLLLVSDGESTDGNPLPTLRALKAQGITVMCCYVTDRDITEPRTLPDSKRWSWDRGAKMMYEAASPADASQVQLNRLRAHGWNVSAGSKYFAQVNHSAVLADLVEAALAIE